MEEIVKLIIDCTKLGNIVDSERLSIERSEKEGKEMFKVKISYFEICNVSLYQALLELKSKLVSEIQDRIQMTLRDATDKLNTYSKMLEEAGCQ